MHFDLRRGRRSVRITACAAVAWLLVAGRVAAAPPDPTGGTGGSALAGSVTVHVVAAGSSTPIPGAFVMVGRADGEPFSGNVAATASDGSVSFSDPALTGSVSVTAGAAGRAYVTVLDLGVAEVVLALPLIDPLPTARLGDQFLGIEVNNGVFCVGDGNLDFGVVLPAVAIDDALGGGAALALSAAAEPLTTPQGPVPVPGNLYFPRQCELLQYFEKSSYHLRVATGRQTLFGLSARAPLTAFLNAATIVDLIRAMSFRELHVLRDRTVTTDSDAFDLNADLPLTANLTLQISNGQPGTTVIAASGGRITASDGSEEVVLTGAGAFDPDTDGSAATLTLTTRPATGELSDLVHAALVTQSRDTDAIGNGRGATTALVRSGLTPPVTRAIASFYDIIEIASGDDRTFSWTDVRSATSPPDRHLHTARLIHRRQVPDPDDPAQPTDEARTFWILEAPGSAQGLTLPVLPPGAPTAVPDPAATLDNDRLELEVATQYLGDDPDGFSYDAFALRDPGRYGTHASTNDLYLRCPTRSEVAGLNLAKGATAEEIVLSWLPSGDYCHASAGVGYEIYASATPRPATAPGSWPFDPPFVKVTAQDLDGNLRDATFTHVPADGLVAYIVVDRGLDGAEGPAGHYGSPAAPGLAP